MSLRLFFRTPNKAKDWLIGLAIVAAIMAGASRLVYASPFTPLIFAGFVAAIAIGIASLRDPVWALYAAIFVTLLPEEQIPEYIHDLLNRTFLLVALGTWLLNVMARRKRINWTGTTLLMLGFVLWGTITLAWSPNLGLGTERVIQYALRLILFLLLIVNVIDTKEALNGLMHTLALNGLVLVLAGVGTVLFVGYEPGTQLHVLGTNVNKSGILLLVTLLGVLWSAMQASERRKTLIMSLSFVFVLLAFILVALGGARGSAISLVITMLAFCFWKPTRPWGIFGLLILVVAAISAPFIFSTTTERFVEQASGLLGGRIPIWQATWLLIRDHVWGGVGIGNASHELIPYYIRLVGLYAKEWRAVHNPVLAVWAETGIPGILLYLCALTSAVWLFIRQARKHREAGVGSLASYFALVTSVFLGFMASWIKDGPEYGKPYFLMLALLLIPAHLDFDESKHIMEVDDPSIGIY